MARIAVHTNLCDQSVQDEKEYIVGRWSSSFQIIY